jgi:sugar lactone lactonase YvrE
VTTGRGASASPSGAGSGFACVLDARASLGECPMWSVAEQALYWVDIDAPALHRFDPATGEDTSTAMPASIGCFAFRARGGFVVALRSGVWIANARGRLERRAAPMPYDDPAHHRFNDGRCDRQGRFWAGTMNEKRDAPSGALYRLETNGSLTEVLTGMTISNGLAWSPDGRTMYHADTPTRTVRAFDYDPATGTPSNPRTLAAWSDETWRPDGATVDSEGNYWVALYSGAGVAKLSPAGETLAVYPVPAQCPTMCAFGGADLRTLYVTTARKNRAPEELARLPQSGGIFAMRVDVPGLPEPHCAF